MFTPRRLDGLPRAKTICLLYNHRPLRGFCLPCLTLFERSEFLIAACKKKKTDRVCGCLYVRLILVLVLGRQIVYGQNTVYLCLSKYTVFFNTQQYKHHVVRSIARSGVSPPGSTRAASPKKQRTEGLLMKLLQKNKRCTWSQDAYISVLMYQGYLSLIHI